jgi:hypothetical protein
MNDRDKLHWIDARQAGNSPLPPPVEQMLATDPHAQELADRVRECDAGVRQAMGDVPVPTGLSSRIMARLELARLEQVRAEQAASAESAPATLPLPSDPAKLNRRRWMWGSAAAALVATSGLGLYAYLTRPAAELTHEDLWADLLDRFETQSAQAASSQSMASAPRKSYPVCELNAGVSVRGWEWIEAFSRHGICYHLKSAGGRTGLLWVLPLEGNPPAAPHLATSPLESQRNTAGLCVTAWRARDVVYVLVAQGDALTPFVGRPGLT